MNPLPRFSRLLSLAGRLALAAAGLLAGLAAAELALRLTTPDPRQYAIWQPGLQMTVEPVPGLLPGVEGEAHFRASSSGLRGPEYPADPAVTTILAIGGSTTEELYIDQPQTWTALLGTLLAERTGEPVWVGNAGKDGRYAQQHVIAMKHLVPQYPGLDMVIVLAGVNDLLIRLVRDTDAAEELQQTDWVNTPTTTDALYTVFEEWPGRGRVRSLRLLWLLGVVNLNAQADAAGLRQTESGDHLVGLRDRRTAASAWRDDLPDLTATLDSYEFYLRQLAALARRDGVRLVLVTHPAVWRADLPPDFEPYLWMGYVGRPGIDATGAYYTPAALADGLAQINARTLAVCAATGVECVDLAPQLNGRTDLFYDDVHTNYAGSRRIAALLADYLASHPAP